MRHNRHKGGRVTPTAVRPPTSKRRWVFVGQASLPEDPVARDHERRGRRWLVLSYMFCPCHIPLTLVLLGAAFGGTAIGAAITGNALQVGVILTAIYALVLWRGFRQIRLAKQIEATGGTIVCTPSGCDVMYVRGDAGGIGGETVAAR